jgi:hypothetical protein
MPVRRWGEYEEKGGNGGEYIRRVSRVSLFRRGGRIIKNK